LTTAFRLSEEDASAKMKGVMTVAAGAVEGFSTVYCGLENSALILGKSLKENTVKVVQHK
jgi:spartin